MSTGYLGPVTEFLLITTGCCGKRAGGFGRRAVVSKLEDGDVEV